MKIGDIVKYSEQNLSMLEQTGCTKKYMAQERNKIFKVVEIPAKHGSKNSIGVSPINDEGAIDKSIIVACAKSDLILVTKRQKVTKKEYAMTDRIKGLTVVLEPNIREDDAQVIINAIKMIRGVGDVQTHISNLDHYMAFSQARMTMEKDIFDLIDKWRKNK
jgi:hypothetical protein